MLVLVSCWLRLSDSDVSCQTAICVIFRYYLGNLGESEVVLENCNERWKDRKILFAQC